MPEPRNLTEAIGLLSTEPAYDEIETPLLGSFVDELVMLYPNLVMAEVIKIRGATVAAYLNSYRGEV